MIDHKEFNQLTRLSKYGPIPIKVHKIVDLNCIQLSITNEEYIKASEKILDHEIKIKELTEFKEWAKVQLNADREAFAKMDYGTPGRRLVIFMYEDDSGNRSQCKGYFLGWNTGGNFPKGLIEFAGDGLKGKVADIHLFQFEFYDWYTKDLNKEVNDA